MGNCNSLASTDRHQLHGIEVGVSTFLADEKIDIRKAQCHIVFIFQVITNGHGGTISKFKLCKGSTEMMDSLDLKMSNSPGITRETIQSFDDCCTTLSISIAHDNSWRFLQNFTDFVQNKLLSMKGSFLS